MENFATPGAPAPAEPPAQGGMNWPISVLMFIVGLAVGAAVVWYLVPRDVMPEAMESPSPSPTATDETLLPTVSPAPLDLEAIFELDAKESGTQLYYSERLGVGFTYLGYDGTPETTADLTESLSESGDTITLAGQTIEVFEKNVSESFKEAIERQFLTGYDPAKCWVLLRDNTEQRTPFYVSAEISFPPPTDPNAPWWENFKDCPQNYSQINAVQYFLYNEKIDDKFLFVRIGQDSPASDGTPRLPEGGSYNWTHSIRILE